MSVRGSRYQWPGGGIDVDMSADADMSSNAFNVK
jgi:hypothetical protein